MRLGHEQQLQKRTVSTGSCGLKIRQQLVFSTESLKTEKKKKKLQLLKDITKLGQPE